MADSIISVTRLPINAFGDFDDVPTKQDTHYRKTHTCTTGGMKNAVGRIYRELREYSQSHGNAAVCSGWLETPAGKLSPRYAAALLDYEFSNSTDLKIAVRKFNDILTQIESEEDAEWRMEDSQR